MCEGEIGIGHNPLWREPSKANLNRNLVRKYVGKDCFLLISLGSIKGKILSGGEGYFFQSSRNPVEEIYKLFIKSIKGDENYIKLDLSGVIDRDYEHKPQNKRISGEIRRI